MGSEVSSRVLEDFNIAFLTEVLGHGFYTAAAELFEDEKGKNVFKHLAKEELEHMAVLSKIADSVKAGRGWMRYDTASGGGDAENKGLPLFPKENALVERLKTNPTDLNAVSIAMESEEKAVEFYSDMLGRAEDRIEREVLEKLIEMEASHLKLLTWEKAALIGTGFWCDIQEFDLEGEKE